MRLYRRLLGFLRPHAWRMSAAVVSNMLASTLDAFAFTLLIPFLNALFDQPNLIPARLGRLAELQQWAIGALLDPTDRMVSLRNVIFVILALVLAKNVFVWLGGQLGAGLQEFVTRDLRDAVFRHLQRLPIGFFQKTKTGQVMSTVLADTEQTRAVITEVVTRTLQNGTMIVVNIIVLWVISPWLTLLALVIAPLLTLAIQPILRKLRSGHRRLRGEYGEITSVLQEVVSGVRLVKSFRGEIYEDARFAQANDSFASGAARITRVAFLSQPLTELIGTSIAVLILWIGARQALGGAPGALDGAQLITFMVIVMRLLPPLKQISQLPTTAQQSLAAAERLFAVLDRPTENLLDRGTRLVDGFREGIEFDRVTFAYEQEPVLTDITFRARRGDVIALVGPSGAGKSTLVDLIPRFYEPSDGRILLDGVDIREIRLDSLRALTGIVSQDTVLFNDTVVRNIAYGAAETKTREQVMQAARDANAHDFISELPQGYDTVLGERGTRLSGGQRQRLAIARALLSDPPILILDEATSALDTESERLVQQAIDRLLEGRTVFVIAHRLSTVAHANQILVLDRGRVVERGTHDELLARRGMYHRLHSLQFRSAAPPSSERTRTTA
ncbi:MAG TPA: ABC transporter transmembrane domain-containing protein [Gemmatimonadaceae bacterium]|nr:ABC transporter transmembrane domain-containing protein [Gemmatimonadaceae bacterium]